MKISLTTTAVTLLLLVGSVSAKTRVVTLDVPGMNCAACPITVKKALTRIAGVNEVDVDLEKWRAVVTYDDARTSVAALTKATSEAGYPSTVKER
jgi:mercuric ion binding protein